MDDEIKKKVLELIEKAESMGEAGITYLQKHFPGVVEGFIHYTVVSELIWILMASLLFGFLAVKHVAVRRRIIKEFTDDRGRVSDDACFLITGFYFMVGIVGLVWFLGSYRAAKDIAHASLSPATYIYKEVIKDGGSESK